ncbi:helicase-exonuclease AddAB subunit AddA, partial [Evtepia sp.]
MAVQRTPEQEAVVKNRGGGLLVSAAAGSGKTRVLVERLLDRVVTEGKNVDEFLIITFTRAAAEELRGRIAGELAQALAQRPEDAHLRRQRGKLYETQISTIHAFCAVLLRQWGHLLDIPADFGLCEDEEAQVLMARALDQVLEGRYEDIDPQGNFARLLDILSAGRDDSRLVDITLDVYEKIQSDAAPMAWLEEQRKILDVSGLIDAGQTPWGALLLEEARQSAAYWGDQMARALALAEGDPALEKAYGESLQATRMGLEAFQDAAAQGWDQAAGVDIPFPRLKGARGVEDPGAQEQIKALRDGCKKAVEGLLAPFQNPSAALLEDMALVYPAMMGLIDLVEDFAQSYAAEKKKRNLLDFSDLEHGAVRLLVGEDGSPTDLARQWGGQYAEIMVDEYQDTNQVQNAIFRALSQEGKNLFLVGDVKQSIYRFRLADPTIFLEKYRTFAPYTQAGEGEARKITLSKNFRSRPQVLEAANDLFRTIMSPQLGEMAYTQEEALHPGGTFPPGEGYEMEYHVLDFSEDPALTQDRQNRAYLEARFVAREIAGLLQAGFPVSDGQGGTRPLQPEDVAILLRSPGPVRAYYTLALEEEGVDWSTQEGGDLFDTTEISVALAWLQIIDNPHQDIPLVAVLRSPLVGMTGDRLAEIRALAQGDFYTALQAAGAAGWADCQAFLTQLEDLRFRGGEQSCHQLLWDLYRRTDMLPVFSAMPGGERRRENLLALAQLAQRFEGAGHKGLFGFLLHLDRVRASGGLSTPPAPPKEGGGVQILSIHRSKGLEYPVVFLCGLGRRWNLSDLQKPVLFHPKLGLGPKGLDRETMVEFPTLARAGVALALKKELLAEEMRLLYVAMTRAKEKLILTHSLSRGASDLRNLAESLAWPADPQVLAGCASAGQWVLLTALARPEGAA